MNKYDENLTALLEILIEEYGYTEYRIGKEEKHYELRKCFEDFKALCNEQENVDNTTPVTNLDLSVRTTNLLVRGGIKTISDLENASFDMICSLRNMGWQSVKEVYDKLIDLKFKRYKK